MDCGRVEEFRRRFDEYARARLKPEDFLQQVEVDAVIEIRDINERSVDEVFALAPFGHGNPAPLFAATDVEIAGPPAVWNEKHLKVMIRQNGRTLALKAWNFAPGAPPNSPPAPASTWHSPSKKIPTPRPAAFPAGPQCSARFGPLKKPSALRNA